MRRILGYGLVVGLGLGILAGCRTPATQPAPRPIAAASDPLTIVPLPGVAGEDAPLPEVHAAPVQLTAHAQGEPALLRGAPETVDPPQGEPAPTPAPPVMEKFPIDLPTALRLAEGGNLQVAYARERISQAWAQAEAARALWLPSLRAGVGYNRHEGRIQDIVGEVFSVGRSNIWTGLGAAVPGAGSPAVPGIYANFHLADAWFEPLAARQAAAARQHAAVATTNDTLHRVALGYLELARTAEEVAITDTAIAEQQELVRLTSTYAELGQGAEADADRAKAELAVRENEQLRAAEAHRVAAARLAQLVRLDAQVELEPQDPMTVAVDLLPADVSVGELVAQALAMRPELGELRHLVAQAVQKMRREQYAILMPSVVLGVSYGGFGGGTGAVVAAYGNRFDADAIAYWQVRNLGFGDRAARAEAASLVRQANVQHVAMLDQVAREVVEAHAQVASRRAQIEVARRGVEVAALSHSRNLDRIQQGQGLPIEVLQANQALHQARREYLRALADYNAAQFTLYRAIGAPGRFAE